MTHNLLLHVEGLPVLQNRVYASADAGRAAVRGDMELVQDGATGLVHNRAFDPGRMHYDEDYQNEQGCSEVFQSHLDEVLDLLRRRADEGGSVIEVGCGKGTFLRRLREAGFDAIGVDPAFEGESAHVIKAPFSQELGLAPAELVVMRHVLEHMPEPLGFLQAIARANDGKGSIYIEVPCFDWIREHRAWFDIFYEHVNYFRPDDFGRMFTSVLEAGHLFGGQYQYVVADLASLRQAMEPVPEPPLDLGRDFTAGIARCASLARDTDGPKAIWGASSKGVIFAHHMQQAGVSLDLAIDINPVKQDLYMAGTGMAIVSPRSALECLPEGAMVFVMNSNYIGEIAAQSRGRFRLTKVDQDDF